MQYCNAGNYTGFIRERIEWASGIGELTENNFFQEAKGTWGWTSYVAFTPTGFGRLDMVARRSTELRVAGKGFHPRPKRTAMLGRLLVRCFLRDEHGWLCVDISVHVTIHPFCGLTLSAGSSEWRAPSTNQSTTVLPSWSSARTAECSFFEKAPVGSIRRTKRWQRLCNPVYPWNLCVPWQILTGDRQYRWWFENWKLKTDLWLYIDEPWEGKVRLYDRGTDKVQTYSLEHSISPHMFSNTRHQNVLPRKLVILRSAFGTPS